MESLRVLPSVLQTVEVPPSLSVTRLASSGDCRLKAVLPPSAYPDWPPSPEVAFGRVVHSLMDLAARGQIQSTSSDARPIASALDQLLHQEEMRLARAPIRPTYTDLQAALGPREWLKRRSLAIDRTLQILVSRPCRAREFDPSQVPGISLARALQSRDFTASELPLESMTLRLRARLDFLSVSSDGLVEVADFKSGNILDDEGEVEAVTALQLRLYGLAILELAPRTRLELKVVSPAGTTQVTFSKGDIENTRAWLAERISGLPPGAQIHADQLAVVGPQCWGCTARLVCPAYRAALSDLWKRTDLSTQLPLDTAGSIVEVEPSAEQTTTLRISDLAARIVKIHRLSPAIYSTTHFDRDSVYWFFNLASGEARLLNGKWRHPRNFHDLPGTTLERRAWTLQVYRVGPTS
jgi:PD-(D/E)XK nuclease superfamily protein